MKWRRTYLRLRGYLFLVPALTIFSWIIYLFSLPAVSDPVTGIGFGAFVLGIFLTIAGIGGWNDSTVVPIPWLARRPPIEIMEQTELEIQYLIKEVKAVVEGLPEGSTPRLTLQTRLDELYMAQSTIRTEMAYAAIADLDKRTGRLISKGLR